MAAFTSPLVSLNGELAALYGSQERCSKKEKHKGSGYPVVVCGLRDRRYGRSGGSLLGGRGQRSLDRYVCLGRRSR